MQNQEFPFKILALAPFNMDTTHVWDQAPISVDRHSLDQAISSMQIEHFLSLDSDLCASGGLTLNFPDIKSLHPDGIVKNNSFFRQIEEAKALIRESRQPGDSTRELINRLEQWPDLPPIDIKPDQPAAKALKQESKVDNILNMVAMPDGDRNQRPSYKNEEDQLSAIQQKVLDTLFKLPAFRKMEGAWSGLRLLLQQGTIQGNVKVDIAPVHLENLEASLVELMPHLIQEPPGLILLDLPFDNSPLSMELMTQAARWASDLMVPMVLWAPCTFLQIESWQQIDTLPFIPNHIQTASYAKFNALKKSEAGPWVCVTCNRFLIRYPYGKDNRPRKAIFSESNPLWISAPWALGTLIAQSVEQSGWPTRFTNFNQYRIQDLALANPDTTPPVVVETVLNHERLDQFIRAGLTPLATARDTDMAFVPKAVTIADHDLAYQLLISRVTAFILWCKENLPSEGDATLLKTQLKIALQTFSEQSHPPGFETIEVVVSQPDSGGNPHVQFILTPISAILPGQQKITLGLIW